MSTQEIWKDIPGYEGLYQVSNLGRVKSFRIWTGTMYVNKEHILINNIEKSGYARVFLRKNNKTTAIRVHRLVAQVFLNNPNNYTCVNHKDENKQNNKVDNLEWCTREYNNRYSMSIKINQYDMAGKFIKKWNSSREIENMLKIAHSSIQKCCKHIYKHAGGYKWEFVKEGC